MKNITVSIDDDIYSKARIVAAERGTSVTALVRENLIRITDGNGRRKKEIAERNMLMEQLLRKTSRFARGPKPTREEMNERQGLC